MLAEEPVERIDSDEGRSRAELAEGLARVSAAGAWCSAAAERSCSSMPDRYARPALRAPRGAHRACGPARGHRSRQAERRVLAHDRAQGISAALLRCQRRRRDALPPHHRHRRAGIDASVEGLADRSSPLYCRARASARSRADPLEVGACGRLRAGRRSSRSPSCQNSQSSRAATLITPRTMSAIASSITKSLLAGQSRRLHPVVASHALGISKSCYPPTIRRERTQEQLPVVDARVHPCSVEGDPRMPRAHVSRNG